jgi:hypothetical protein
MLCADRRRQTTPMRRNLPVDGGAVAMDGTSACTSWGSRDISRSDREAAGALAELMSSLLQVPDNSVGTRSQISTWLFTSATFPPMTYVHREFPRLASKS